MPTALPHYAFARGAIAVIPLSLACAPWGLLAGSMAIDAQFTPLQAQGLSAIVFAGAAQLVAIGMVKSGASLISIVLTTLLLTSQHLLYGMHLRLILYMWSPSILSKMKLFLAIALKLMKKNAISIK